MSDVSCKCTKEKAEGLSADEFDMVFDIVSNRDRRVMLHQLEKDDPMDVENLAEEMEPHVDADPPRIVTALHQQHLPRMDDTGILDYDPRSETVRYYGHPFLEELLDYTAAEDLGTP